MVPDNDVQFEIRRTSTPKQKPTTVDKLGFGRVFSDHMFKMEYERATGWTRPRIEPYAALTLDPAAAVLHYAQSLFEGLKAFRRDDGRVQLFRPDFHARRMQGGAKRLCMPPVEPLLLEKAVSQLVALDHEWVPAAMGASLYLRPTLIATEAFLGVRPAEKYLFFIITSPVASYYSGGLKPLRIWIERDATRAAPGGLGAVKAAANYIASLEAAMLAKEKGYDQVLWLDAVSKSCIEEVGTMNVFFVINDEVVTPPLSGTILGGATRDSVLTLLRHWGVPVRERALTLAELEDASRLGQVQEAFGSGTAAVISPVGEFAHRDSTIVVNNGEMGPIAKRLLDTLSGIQYGTEPDPFGWTRIVSSTGSQPNYAAFSSVGPAMGAMFEASL